MADKTIGELDAVKVGDLPVAPDIYDDTLIPVEQQGEAKHITGRQWTDYARAAASADVKRAVDAANAAEQSKAAAAESARDAADIALHPPILKDGSDHWWIWNTEANDYRDSGIDAGVSLEVVEQVITGEPGTTAKVENLGTATDPRLQFTLPRGDQGETGDVWVPSVSEEGELTWEKNGEAAPQPVNIKGPRGEPSTVPGPKGDPGVSPTVSVSKEGGVTTLTITDAEGGHTAEIHDGDVSQEALDAALAEKQNVLTFDDAPTEGSDNPVKSGGVWDGLQRKSNPNLLDNWCFGNPINQRGQTAYTISGGLTYTIDRWVANNGSTVSIADNGLNLTIPKSTLYQHTGISYDEFKLLANRKATFSVLTASNELITVTVTLPTTIDATKSLATAKGRNISIGISVHISKSPLYVRIFNGTETLLAAKLELGPVQTLAHKEGDQWVLNDPPPNYQQELAKCQRYQLVLGGISPYESFGPTVTITQTSARVQVPVPVTMRAKPTITGNGMFRLYGGSSYISTNVSLGSVSGMSKNTVEFAVTGTDFQLGVPYLLSVQNDLTARIILDANL